jgi:hypothetical protein
VNSFSDLSVSIAIPFSEAGNPPFNLDTLNRVNPGLMKFLSLAWYELITQANDLSVIDKSQEWWRVRIGVLCGRGDSLACKNQDSLDLITTHIRHMRESGMRMTSYADFCAYVPGRDPNSEQDYCAIFDRLFGKEGSVDASWFNSVLSYVQSLNQANENPELEGLYQAALQSATAKFLNQEDLVSARSEFNRKLEVYQSQTDAGDSNSALTRIEMRAHMEQKIAQGWRDAWSGALAHVSGLGACSEGVECGLDALTAYADKRGFPPMPDLTLIGSDEAKKLLE